MVDEIAFRRDGRIMRGDEVVGRITLFEEGAELTFSGQELWFSTTDEAKAAAREALDV